MLYVFYNIITSKIVYLRYLLLIEQLSSVFIWCNTRLFFEKP